MQIQHPQVIDILTTFDDSCALMCVMKGCMFMSPYDNIHPVQLRNQFVSDQLDVRECEDKVAVVLVVEKVDTATSMDYRVLKYDLIMCMGW